MLAASAMWATLPASALLVGHSHYSARELHDSKLAACGYGVLWQFCKRRDAARRGEGFRAPGVSAN